MKKCNKCDLMKHEEQFNSYFRFGKEYVRGYCRNCERVQKREYKQRVKNLLNSEEDAIYGSASIEYNELPNHYVNEEQRLAVFRIMKLLGYSFNRSLGIWYKLPFKLQDGTFTNLKLNKCRPKETVGIVFTNRIKELYKMSDEGISKKEIAKHFKVQQKTVDNYLDARERKSRKNGNQ